MSILRLCPFESFSALFELYAPEFVVLSQKVVELLVLSCLGVKVEDLELMVLLHVFYFFVKVLVMMFCDLKCIFDGFDLLVEFVDVGELGRARDPFGGSSQEVGREVIF